MNSERDGAKTIQGHREVLWSGKSGSEKSASLIDGKKSGSLFRCNTKS